MAKVVVTVDEMTKVLENAEQEYLGKLAKVANLVDAERPQFIGMRSKTMPKYLKKGRVTGRTMQEALGVDPANLWKFSEFGAGLCYEYEKSVTNALIAEGKDPSEYKRGESWAKPYNDSKVIRINPNKPEDGYYFFVTLNANNTAKVEYLDLTPGAEMRSFTKDQLAEWLPVEGEAKNQGLTKENQIKVRTFKMESVYTISAMGNEYSIR